MGRSPCCEKVGLKKGPWTPEEDQKLLAYIEEHGHGSWRSLPSKAGLERCGKSCRLRWTNYLRPDIKRGKFSLQEEQTIIQLHALLGNRWSAIATHLPKRTDNEIKNYWNTHLKKRLAKMGIDPVTHKPKNDSLQTSGGGGVDGQSKSAAKLSHLAQWESARLEAEARLVRESKLRSHSLNHHDTGTSSSYSPFGQFISKMTSVPPTESPTSTLTFSEAAPPHSSKQHEMFEFVGMSTLLNHQAAGMVKEEGGGHEYWNKTTNNRLPMFHPEEEEEDMSTMPIHDEAPDDNAEAIEAEGFTDLLLNSCGDPSLLSDSDNPHHELDNKNYWNTILNLVDSSPSDDHDSPVF